MRGYFFKRTKTINRNFFTYFKVNKTLGFISHYTLDKKDLSTPTPSFLVPPGGIEPPSSP